MNGTWIRSARYALMVLLGSALLAAAPGLSVAQPVDVPPTWGGDFWNRPRLTGDWGGWRSRLAERGVMRLRLAARPEGLLAAVRALAPAALWAGEELVVPGPAALRPRVLDAVRALGVDVRGLTAEEGRLDVLYRELVAEAEAKRGHGGAA